MKTLNHNMDSYYNIIHNIIPLYKIIMFNKSVLYSENVSVYKQIHASEGTLTLH